jgi:hypothetical protein
MQVLEHEHRGTRIRYLGHERVEHLVGATAALHKLLERAAGLPRHVDKWPQRGRREQCLAGTPEHTRRRAPRLAEPPDHGSLSYTRLASHQYQPPLPRALHLAEQVLKPSERDGALNQLR